MLRGVYELIPGCGLGLWVAAWMTASMVAFDRDPPTGPPPICASILRSSSSSDDITIPGILSGPRSLGTTGEDEAWRKDGCSLFFVGGSPGGDAGCGRGSVIGGGMRFADGGATLGCADRPLGSSSMPPTWSMTADEASGGSTGFGATSGGGVAIVGDAVCDVYCSSMRCYWIVFY